MLPSPKPYQRGELIGRRYQVYDHIQGGMGDVYFCLDQETDLPIALKTPKRLDAPDVESERSDRKRQKRHLQRFLEEAGVWVSLGQHPHIVRCYYLDIINGEPFLFLEWIASPERRRASLSDWLKQNGPLDGRASLTLLAGICYGLIHAAQIHPGLIHRDLKPGNILLAQDMTPKVSDFGFAQAIQASADDRGRRWVGTPPYMPPEQWRGQEKDARSDIYAIGCILYECLTGRRLFEAKSHEAWYRAHTSHARPSLPEEMPAALNEIVQTCLRMDAEERYADIQALLQAIEEVYSKEFEQSLPLPPTAETLTASDLINRGNSYAYLERYPAALADYDRAIEIEPALPQAYENRGAVQWLLADPQAALADLNHAIRLYGDHVQRQSQTMGAARAYYNRGVIYQEQGQTSLALLDYNRAIALNPNLALAFFNRANLLTSIGRSEQALVDFNRAITVAPNMADAYHNRGLTLLQLREYDAALADFDRALARNPDLAAARFNRGVAHQIVQQYEAAIEDFSAAIELTPGMSRTYYHRGVVYHYQQKFREAVADFTRAILLGPEYPELYFNRGLSLSALDLHKEAIANFNRSLELDAGFVAAHFQRALAFESLGWQEEAIAAHLETVLHDPRPADAFLRLSAIYNSRGDAVNATFCAQRAAQLQQPSPETATEQNVDAAENSIRQAIHAFQSATSPRQMNQLLAEFPSLMESDVIARIEQLLVNPPAESGGSAQVSSNQRGADAARLYWLRTLIQQRDRA